MRERVLPAAVVRMPRLTWRWSSSSSTTSLPILRFGCDSKRRIAADDTRGFPLHGRKLGERRQPRRCVECDTDSVTDARALGARALAAIPLRALAEALRADAPAPPPLTLPLALSVVAPGWALASLAIATLGAVARYSCNLARLLLLWLATVATDVQLLLVVALASCCRWRWWWRWRWQWRWQWQQRGGGRDAHSEQERRGGNDAAGTRDESAIAMRSARRLQFVERDVAALRASMQQQKESLLLLLELSCRVSTLEDESTERALAESERTRRMHAAAATASAAAEQAVAAAATTAMVAGSDNVESARRAPPQTIASGGVRRALEAAERAREQGAALATQMRECVQCVRADIASLRETLGATSDAVVVDHRDGGASSSSLGRDRGDAHVQPQEWHRVLVDIDSLKRCHAEVAAHVARLIMNTTRQQQQQQQPSRGISDEYTISSSSSSLSPPAVAEQDRHDEGTRHQSDSFILPE